MEVKVKDNDSIPILDSITSSVLLSLQIPEIMDNDEDNKSVYSPPEWYKDGAKPSIPSPSNEAFSIVYSPAVNAPKYNAV